MWKKRQIHPSPGASLRAFPSSVGRLWVCFRSHGKKWGVSKCSVLPGGCQRGRTPHEATFSRLHSSDMPLGAAVSRQNGALRNITIFSDVPPTHTHSSGGEGGRTGARRKREAPCGGWVYPGVVVGGGKEKREKRERKREKGKKAGRRGGIRPGFWRIKGLIIRLG